MQFGVVLSSRLRRFRAIQDQLTLSGASALEAHALHVKLNEVRNRYDQIDSDARSAEDRKAEILGKQQEERRWQADQAAREARAAEQADEPAKAHRPEDQDLREVEERAAPKRSGIADRKKSSNAARKNNGNGSSRRNNSDVPKRSGGANRRKRNGVDVRKKWRGASKSRARSSGPARTPTPSQPRSMAGYRSVSPAFSRSRAATNIFVA